MWYDNVNMIFRIEWFFEGDMGLDRKIGCYDNSLLG